MYIEGKACWLNHLDAALQKYNNRVHGTTKTSPFAVSNKTAKLAPHKLIPSNKNNNEGALRKKKLSKFQVRGFVRVPDERHLYSKGYTTNWNRSSI